ncbi:thiamine-phosphate pyrophosphorylase [Leifsonia sp. AK011]|uniref:thiamine phosphate synthase n=1 Tax=Leifsonia sp. AK011 TaxID=2723075 RepID=UPI0015C92211|nr:thiamine phosphate synthase [Leifsonia sp. AK011]NYF10558.1 thiamine-phosphate pyrophosphorylase [Leifsonia sp. AK011]
MNLSLYLVTDTDAAARAGRTVLETVALAVDGGVTAVQVRDKRADARSLLALVTAVGRTVPPGVSVIVNDRVDVYLAAKRESSQVAGVHLGQSDLPAERVREIVGPHAVIGVTASSDEQIRAAAVSRGRVDYVGLGVVRETSTKTDAPPALGVDGIVRRASRCPLPAVAIGGIVLDDVAALRAGGLAGVAVASAIGGARDPEAAARDFARAWGAA